MPTEDLRKLSIDKGRSAGPARRRRSFFWPLFWLVLVGAAILAAVRFLPRGVQVRVAAVATASPAQAVTALNASGYVAAQRKAAVASKVTARLIWLGVEEGDKVQAGQVIALLESEDVEAQVRQAKAQLRERRHDLDAAQAELADAQAQFERQRQAVRASAAPRADYDAAEARLRKARAAQASAEAAIESAKAVLAQAETAVEYTRLRAPFDASVLTKNADVGDIVTPLGAAANARASVVTIADLSSLQAEVDVSESSISKIRTGQPAIIQLDAYPDVRFPGRTHMIVPTADRSKATILVKVRFQDLDPRVLPEMSAKVAFLERELSAEELAPRLAAPVQAVVRRDGRDVAFVVKDGAAILTPVTLGRPMGDLVEITDGLAAGDRLVIQPPESLASGEPVRPVE